MSGDLFTLSFFVLNHPQLVLLCSFRPSLCHKLELTFAATEDHVGKYKFSSLLVPYTTL